METLGLIEAQCWETEFGSLPVTFDWHRHFSQFVLTVCRWRSPRLVANLLGVCLAIFSPILTVPFGGLTPPAIAQSTCTILLRRGDQGNAVKSLQSALAARKYTISVDGDFGGETERILKLFQASSQLVADGVYGEQTCKALTGNGTSSKPAADTTTPRNISNNGILKPGAQGKEVRRLQEKLRLLGYAIPATGTFDDSTKQAVLNFQARKNLRQDGIVGVNTNKALDQALLKGEYYVNPPNLGNTPSERRTGSPSNTVTRRNQDDRYIVAIPKKSETTLRYVRSYVPDAFLLRARRGEYVQAGVYGDRNSAESVSYALRAYGLDARVIAD